jgi:hypothetical protein
MAKATYSSSAGVITGGWTTSVTLWSVVFMPLESTASGAIVAAITVLSTRKPHMPPTSNKQRMYSNIIKRGSTPLPSALDSPNRSEDHLGFLGVARGRTPRLSAVKSKVDNFLPAFYAWTVDTAGFPISAGVQTACSVLSP